MNEEHLRSFDKYAHLAPRLFAGNGVELWRQNSQYLVVDKAIRYGKFYNKLDDAKQDPRLLSAMERQ